MFTAGELERKKSGRFFCILPSASVFIINIVRSTKAISNLLIIHLELEDLYERKEDRPLLEPVLPTVLWLGYETACLKQLLKVCTTSPFYFIPCSPKSENSFVEWA